MCPNETSANQLNTNLIADRSTLNLVVQAELAKYFDPVIGDNVEVKVGSMPRKRIKDDGIGRSNSS